MNKMEIINELYDYENDQDKKRILLKINMKINSIKDKLRSKFYNYISFNSSRVTEIKRYYTIGYIKSNSIEKISDIKRFIYSELSDVSISSNNEIYITIDM